MIKFIIGFILGFLYVVCSQYNLEKGYVETGIAKLCGKLYEIKPYVKKEWYE